MNEDRFDYSGFQATALRLISKFGADCVWHKPAADNVSSKPWLDDGNLPQVETPCRIAFFSPLDLSRGRGQFADFLKGTDITTYTEVGLLAGSCGFVPESSDRCFRNGEDNSLEIVMIDKIAPSGVPVLYFVMVK